MKKESRYFSNDLIISFKRLNTSALSLEQQNLYKETKSQILKSVEAGRDSEGAILSNLKEKLGERKMFGFPTSDTDCLAIKELLADGKLIKLNNGRYYVPKTECEKLLAEQVKKALRHFRV